MNEQQALAQMVPPSRRRRIPRQFNGGVIQIWTTRVCDKACFGCTQASNLQFIKGTPTSYITREQFERACISLKDYFGVVGMFGGNPAIHPQFEQLCNIMAKYIPFERRGLWCNKLFGQGAIARRTFNPRVSNINVHLDKQAAEEFRRDWPEVFVNGVDVDSRHSPPYVAMKDVLNKTCPSCGGDKVLMWGGEGASCSTCDGNGFVYDEEKAWGLIANCDINQTWSAMIGVFRGELRAWFCEIAGAQAMLHQNEPDYPDTGLSLTEYQINVNGVMSSRSGQWWEVPMSTYTQQVRKHCHECGVPLRGYGELSQGGETERVSQTHQGVYNPKDRSRSVTLVTELTQLQQGKITKVIDYIGNGKV